MEEATSKSDLLVRNEGTRNTKSSIVEGSSRWDASWMANCWHAQPQIAEIVPISRTRLIGI